MHAPTALRRTLLTMFAAAFLLIACGDDLAGPAVPTTFELIGDSIRLGAVATPLPDSVRVRFLDQRGDPFPFARIFFTVPEGGGSVDPQSSLTDSTGVASTQWTLGPRLGDGHVLSASAGIYEVRLRAAARHDLSGRFFGPYNTPTAIGISGVLDLVQTDTVAEGVFTTGQGRRGDVLGSVSGSEFVGTIEFTDPCGGAAQLRADVEDVGRTLMGSLDVTDCAGAYEGEFRLVRR